MKKRSISWLMVWVIVISLLPVTLWADTKTGDSDSTTDSAIVGNEIEGQCLDYDYLINENQAAVKARRTPSAAQFNPNGWLWPVRDNRCIYSPYNVGFSNLIAKRGKHEGIDISYNADLPIFAAKEGTVIVAYDGCPHSKNRNDNCGGGFGNHVQIRHSDGSVSIYGHMKQGSICVKEQQVVSQGALLGVTGASGSASGIHLHFSILYNDAYVNVNPKTNTYITSNNTDEYSNQEICSGGIIDYIYDIQRYNSVSISPYIGSRNAVGDFNGDGLDDYAVLYDYGRARAQIHVFLSTGNGFSEEVWWTSNEVNSFDAVRASGRFTAGDFNGDGLCDIALMYEYSDLVCSVFVLLSKGDQFETTETWIASSEYKASSVTDRFVAGDFNGDGMDDIAAMYKYDDSTAQIHVLLSNGGTFSDANMRWLTLSEYNASEIADRMAVGDFNGDGLDDIAAMYEYGDASAQIHVFLSNGNAFVSGGSWYTNETGFTAARVKGRFTAGDFNGDGLDDIAAMYDYGNMVAVDMVWLSQQSCFSREQHWCTHSEFYADCVSGKYFAGDYTGDGKSDIAGLYYYSDKSIFHVMTSNSTSFTWGGWNRIDGYDCLRTGGMKSYWEEDYEPAFTLTSASWHLDVNAYLDGTYYPNSFGDFADIDVVINNGKNMDTGISDYYKKWLSGTTYQINVQPKDGYVFKGVKTGTCEGVTASGATGTIGDEDVYVFLDFEKSCQHQWNDGVVTTAATCTTAGVRTYTCSKCGETKTETILALGHSMTPVAEKAATCTEPGNNAYYTCQTCGKVFKDSAGVTETTAAAETIPALGHNFVNGTCTRCGKSDGSARLGDLTGDGVVTSADAVLLARYLSRLEELTAAQLTAADLDKDGVVTVADGVLISRVLAGLETVE